jgi:hypothetical protein
MKKIALFLVALLLAFSLLGCVSTRKPAESSTTVNSTSTTLPTTTTTSTPTTTTLEPFYAESATGFSGVMVLIAVNETDYTRVANDSLTMVIHNNWGERLLFYNITADGVVTSYLPDGLEVAVGELKTIRGIRLARNYSRGERYAIDVLIEYRALLTGFYKQSGGRIVGNAD